MRKVAGRLKLDDLRRGSARRRRSLLHLREQCVDPLVPGDQDRVRDPDRADVHHQAQPDPRLRELPQLVAVQHEQDAEDRDGVDEPHGDAETDLVVGIGDGRAFRTAALTDLRAIDAVEHHAAEPDDGSEDVEDEHDLVGRARNGRQEHARNLPR